MGVKISPELRQQVFVPQRVQAATSVTHGDAFKVYTQTTGGSITFTLPSARAGDGPFYFNVANAASVIVVTPQSTDSIGGNAAGASVTLPAQAGTLIGFYCNTAGTWSPLNGGSGLVGPVVISTTVSPALTIFNNSAAAGEEIRFVAFSPTQKQSYISWYESDNTTRRAFLGFGNVNDETFIIDTDTATGTISLRTTATVRMTIAAAGNVTISQPSSGSALTINTTASTDGLQIFGPAAAGASLTVAGNGVTAANGFQFQYSSGDNGNISLGGSIRIRITGTSGAVTIFTPLSASNALTVTGFAGTTTILATAGATGDHVITANGITSGRSTINWAVNSVSVAFTGINSGAGDLIAGTTAQTFCVRVQGKDFAISTNSGGSSQFTVTAAGDTAIQGNVGFNGVGAQAASTGWGTPTGAATVTNFPGATATLVQCSNVIAQLITQLKRYGLFGA